MTRPAPLSLALLAAMSLALPIPGVAGPLADRAAEAEARLAAGDAAGAVAAARGVLDAVWTGVGTIGFTNALLVAEPAAGFGIYTPRADNRFAKAEPILIYAEPFGYGFGDAGEGQLSIAFAVDLKVLAADGSELGAVPDLTALSVTTRFPNKEFQANLAYNLGGIEAGSYILETTLRDRNSDRSGSFSVPIEIVE